MKKYEFLRELEISLKGKLPEADINEILSDYNDIFEDGLLDNKTEDEISEGIGSPAAISKAIVDESINNTVGQSPSPVEKDFSNLAPMSKRFLAYLIDTTLIVVLFLSLFMPRGTVTGVSQDVLSPGSISQKVHGDYLGPHYQEHSYLDSNNNTKKIKLYKDGKRIFSGNPRDYYQYREDNNIPHEAIRTIVKSRSMFTNFGSRLPILSVLPFLLIFMAFGVGNILTAFEIWLFKGYSLGKWITKIRVVKLDEGKITFWDGFLREIALKFFGSAITSGVLNMVSFVLGCVTPDHKTVHDLAAKTKVINIKR